MIIPAACRKQYGLETGQEVVLRVTHEGLLITTYDQALQRFQDDVAATWSARMQAWRWMN